jgi:hypothetical protein
MWPASPGGSKGRRRNPRRAGGRHRDGALQQATGGVSRQQSWSRPAPWSRWPGRSGRRGLRCHTQQPPTPELSRLRSSSFCAVSGPYVLHSRDTCRPAHRTPTRQDGLLPLNAKSQTSFSCFYQLSWRCRPHRPSSSRLCRTKPHRNRGRRPGRLLPEPHLTAQSGAFRRWPSSSPRRGCPPAKAC